MLAANLVIARGGYNTIAELSLLNIPAICIPTPRVGDNQTERIVRASTKGMIEYSSFDSTTLAKKISSVAKKPSWHTYMPSIDSTKSLENTRKLASKLIELLMDTAIV